MNSRKFTLLEVLIAMTLLTMLTIGLLSTYSTLNKNWISASASNEVFYDLMHVERLFESSIPNAIPFVWRDSEETKRRLSTFLGQRDQVSFCYLHRLNNLEEGAIRFITFVVEDDGLVAYYKNRPWVDIEDLNDPSLTRVVVSDSVTDIQVEYAVYEPGDDEILWEDNWENQIDSDDERFDIPLAIQISVDWESDRHETFLYRTAGNSKYQRWGDWKPDTSSGGGGVTPGDKDDSEEPICDPTNMWNPCFAPDTIVNTPSGYCYIKDLKAGNSVYGFSHKYQKVYIDQVSRVSIIEVKNYDLYKIKTTKETIRVTGVHKFKTRTGNISARDIRPDDLLMSLDKKEIKVLEITKEKYSGKVYNLEIKNGSKYSVGLEDIIVYH